MNLLKTKNSQLGMMLIEGMMAILIFSMGILAMVGMQAASVKYSSDAKYRADASLLANQIIGQMWVDQGPPDASNLPSYAHNPSPGDASCSPGGGASTNANVIAWLEDIEAALPGASADKQQIIVGNNNTVTVTICWKGPQDQQDRHFSATAQINI